MSVLTGSLAAVLLLAAPAHPEPPQRVAVYATGPAEMAGALQRSLENALSNDPAVILVPASEFAPGLAAAEPAPAPALDASGVLQEAENAYYEGRMDAAREKLTAATAALQPMNRAPPAQLQRMLLWRLAVGLARNEKTQADADARLLLVLVPDLTVDLSVYPPVVDKAIQDQRAKGMHIVTVDAAAPGLEILVDDLAVKSPFTIPVGAHALVVRAPGYRPISRPIADEARVAVALAPMLPGSDATITAALTGASGAALPATLRDMQEVDVWVLAGIRVTTARLAIWGVHDAAPRARSESYDARHPIAAGEWMVRALRPGIRESGDRGASATALSPEAALAFVALDRRFTAAGSATAPGASVRVPLGGVGPRLAVRADRGGFAGELSLGWATFAPSKITFRKQGSTPSSVGSSTGGSFAELRASAGWRVVAPLTLSATLFHQRYDGGDDFDVLPSFVRTGVALEAVLRQPVGGGVGVELGAGVSPWSTLSEPKSPSGSKPTVSLSPSVRGGVRYESGRWQLAALARAESIAVRFHGAATARYAMGLHDEKRTEQPASFALVVGRRF